MLDIHPMRPVPHLAVPHRAVPRTRNRRLAVLLALLGLLMQGVAPYLPMPAMDGGAAEPRIAGFIAGLPICLSARPVADGNRAPSAPHPGDCAACLVMAQAGATLVPALAEFAPPSLDGREAGAAARSLPARAAPAGAFSSRAPPVSA